METNSGSVDLILFNSWFQGGGTRNGGEGYIKSSKEPLLKCSSKNN